VLGRTIAVNDRPYEVIGVMPRAFPTFVHRPRDGSRVALLASGGLLLQTFQHFRQLDLGIRSDNVLTFVTPLFRYPEYDRRWPVLRVATAANPAPAPGRGR
jgi:hypothetical protein